MKDQLAMAVGKFQFRVIAGVNTVGLLCFVKQFKSPELIDASVAGVLNNLCIFLISFFRNIQIKTAMETFDDVDFSSAIDIPSLVETVVCVVDYNLFALLAACFRNIHKQLSIKTLDKTRATQKIVPSNWL